MADASNDLLNVQFANETRAAQRYTLSSYDWQ